MRSTWMCQIATNNQTITMSISTTHQILTASQSDCISESSFSGHGGGAEVEDPDYLAEDDCSESDSDKLGNYLPQKRVPANVLTPSTLRSTPKRQRHGSRRNSTGARNDKEPAMPSERDRTVQHLHMGQLAPPSDAISQPHDALCVLESTSIDSGNLVLTLRLENFRQHFLAVKPDGFNRAGISR